MKIYRFFCVFFIGLFLVSCSSLGESHGTEENSYSVYYLDNGIPVYFHENPVNRVFYLSTVFKKGALPGNDDVSGVAPLGDMEAVTLSLMQKETGFHSENEIIKFFSDTSSGCYSGSNQDYSFISFSSIDKYFEKTFDYYSGMLLNPVFSEPVLEKYKVSYKNRIADFKSDPFAMLNARAFDFLYQNHPYGVIPSVPSEAFADSITLEGLSDCHKKLLDKDRIALFFSGDISPKKLLRLLNRKIGKLESRGFEAGGIPPLELDTGIQLVTLDFAENSSYAVRITLAPERDSEDYFPFALASMIMDDVLFNVVREKYGLCYSVFNTATVSQSPVNEIIFYRVSDLDRLVSALNESFEILKQGKVIKGKSPEGGFEYSGFEEVLHNYKNKYINSFYGSNTTNRGLVGMMVLGELYNGDFSYYEDFSGKIEEITVQDINRVLDKYWFAASSQWSIGASSGSITDVKVVDFKEEQALHGVKPEA